MRQFIQQRLYLFVLKLLLLFEVAAAALLDVPCSPRGCLSSTPRSSPPATVSCQPRWTTSFVLARWSWGQELGCRRSAPASAATAAAGFSFSSGSRIVRRSASSSRSDFTSTSRNLLGESSGGSLPLLHAPPITIMDQSAKQTKKYDVSIHWYRNGLRFHDNPCLRDASDQSHSLLPLVVIDPEAPFAQTQGRRAGCVRANFVLESIEEVRSTLAQPTMNSNLVVILGKPYHVLPRVVRALQADALFYEQEAAEPIRLDDAKVLRRLPKETCRHIRGYATHTLHAMDHYVAHCKGGTAPATYGGFTKIFQKLTVPPEIEPVTAVPPLPPNAIAALQEEFGDQLLLRTPSLEELGYDQATEQLAHRTDGGIDFAGGEQAALQLLDLMMKRTRWVASFEKPNTSPNALKVDTTGLSPYVKHGCLSPRKFYHELARVYAKYNPKELSKPPVSLHGQLMWREYNYLMGYTTPKFDRMVGNPVARQIPWDNDPTALRAWTNSQTGYPFIDAIMTQLRQTGWIHHLARHAVACFLTRGDLWQSWEDGARVFEEYLIDADWSINNFNWQWLSCTAHFYQYFRCYSPVAFGKKTDPNGDYIRKWLPQFRNMPSKYIYEPWEAPLSVQRGCGVVVGENYPNPIVDHKVISKSNMLRMKQSYDAQASGQPLPGPDAEVDADGGEAANHGRPTQQTRRGRPRQPAESVSQPKRQKG